MRDTFIRHDCAPCFVDTAMKFLLAGTNDKKKIMEGLQQVLVMLGDDFSCNGHTFLIGNKMARFISKFLKNGDIFKEIKHRSNQLCMEMYPLLDKRYSKLDRLDEKLDFALVAGVAGNVIDVGTSGHVFKLDPDEIFQVIDDINEQGFKIDHREALKKLILDDREKHFLVMLDNAGEIVFDKFLIRLLKENQKHVTCMAKGQPIANDATFKDLKEVGIDTLCDDILLTSIASLGYTISDNDDRVIDKVNGMDVVIGKGQANLETLSTYRDQMQTKHVFLLSKVKCNTVAEFQGVKKGDNVIKEVL